MQSFAGFLIIVQTGVMLMTVVCAVYDGLFVALRNQAHPTRFLCHVPS